MGVEREEEKEKMREGASKKLFKRMIGGSVSEFVVLSLFPFRTLL